MLILLRRCFKGTIRFKARKESLFQSLLGYRGGFLFSSFFSIVNIYRSRSETDITTGFEPVIGGSNPSESTNNTTPRYRGVVLFYSLVMIRM